MPPRWPTSAQRPWRSSAAWAHLADAIDFLNSTGAWESQPDGVTTTGLDQVDFWIGGLAEKQMPFGGLLGSTFNFVFETQLEQLQDGDRFYYLARTAGLNFFTELEQASFADLVMRNTGTTHLPGDVFSTPTHIIERSDPSTWPAGEVIQVTNGIRYTGADHVVLGGTNGTDRLISSEGDDTLHGDGGADTLEGGSGNDTIFGGNGNDRISDQFGDDVLQGGDGRDTINAGPGLDLVLGGAGADFLNGGEDDDELFGGRGDDILLGGDAGDALVGNEGDDWFEGGASGDGMIGDNGHPFGLSTISGNDVFIGGGGGDRMEAEHGDDIFVGGEGVDRHEGMTGFDWMTYELDTLGVTADLTIRADVLVPPTPSPDAILDRFNDVEGLSGSSRDDVLRGDDLVTADLQLANAVGLDNVLRNDALITGLSAVIGGAANFAGGNIILGGAGSDTIEGRGGDDIIDGDAYLHVALTSRTAGAQIIREIVTAPGGADVDTAVYSDAIASYDIINNLDGTYTVAHARGTQTDGTDTLRNIERLSFADQLLSIVQVAATGTVIHRRHHAGGEPAADRDPGVQRPERDQRGHPRADLAGRDRPRHLVRRRHRRHVPAGRSPGRAQPAGTGHLRRPARQSRNGRFRCHQPGQRQPQHPAHRRARHQRHDPDRGAGADRHRRHHRRRRRYHGSQLRLPLAGAGRSRLDRHRRCDHRQLHAGRGRGRPADPGGRELHRRSGQRRGGGVGGHDRGRRCVRRQRQC